MTLHHVEDNQQLLKQAVRVLAPGGYLLIRDHDCQTSTDHMMIDVEHNLYDLNLPDYNPTSLETMYPKSASAWIKQITNLNMNLHEWNLDLVGPRKLIGPTRPFYAVFIKPK